MSTGDFETIDAGGERRSLNLLPSSPSRLVMVPMHRVTLPRSEIKPYDAWPACIKTKNQSDIGACNGHSTATGLEYCRYQTGQPHVPLSAWWVYGQLVKGRDVGSNILAALELVKRKGCAPESEVKYGDYSGRYPAAVNSGAARYRLEMGSRLMAWDEIEAAVAMRRAVNLSICVGQNFNDFDADGCPGVGRGQANHAVMVGGKIKKGRKGNNLVWMKNSWDEWGIDGGCWLSEDHILYASYFEAFTFIDAVEDLSDSDNPPVAPVA